MRFNLQTLAENAECDFATNLTNWVPKDGLFPMESLLGSEYPDNLSSIQTASAFQTRVPSDLSSVPVAQDNLISDNSREHYIGGISQQPSVGISNSDPHLRWNEYPPQLSYGYDRLLMHSVGGHVAYSNEALGQAALQDAEPNASDNRLDGMTEGNESFPALGQLPLILFPLLDDANLPVTGDKSFSEHWLENGEANTQYLPGNHEYWQHHVPYGDLEGGTTFQPLHEGHAADSEYQVVPEDYNAYPPCIAQEGLNVDESVETVIWD
mgnify:CR=1 FL=1